MNWIIPLFEINDSITQLHKGLNKLLNNMLCPVLIILAKRDKNSVAKEQQYLLNKFSDKLVSCVFDVSS